jgi:hypothetical protein
MAFMDIGGLIYAIGQLTEVRIFTVALDQTLEIEV